MRVVIEDEYLEYLFEKGRGKGKPKFSFQIEQTFITRVNQLLSVKNTNELRELKSLRFEQLSGDLKGKYSIRVNSGFRIILRIERQADDIRIEIVCIEEMNNHYQ